MANLLHILSYRALPAPESLYSSVGNTADSEEASATKLLRTMPKSAVDLKRPHFLICHETPGTTLARKPSFSSYGPSITVPSLRLLNRWKPVRSRSSPGPGSEGRPTFCRQLVNGLETTSRSLLASNMWSPMPRAFRRSSTPSNGCLRRLSTMRGTKVPFTEAKTSYILVIVVIIETAVPTLPVRLEECKP